MVTDTGQGERVTMRLPIEIRRKLEQKASDRYMKLTAYIRMVLVNHCKEEVK